jgi:hypothetical protein
MPNLIEMPTKLFEIPAIRTTIFLMVAPYIVRVLQPRGSDVVFERRGDGCWAVHVYDINNLSHQAIEFTDRLQSSIG